MRHVYIVGIYLYVCVYAAVNGELNGRYWTLAELNHQPRSDLWTQSFFLLLLLRRLFFLSFLFLLVVDVSIQFLYLIFLCVCVNFEFARVCVWVSVCGWPVLCAAVLMACRCAHKTHIEQERKRRRGNEKEQKTPAKNTEHRTIVNSVDGSGWRCTV